MLTTNYTKTFLGLNSLRDWEYGLSQRLAEWPRAAPKGCLVVAGTGAWGCWS